jgi:NADPH-dependent 2,4-dienoyl-CoA reductase/sulfur reductase-like enzyme
MRHTVTGEPDWVPLGLTANRAGRAIGQPIAGNPTSVGEIAGTAVVKAFDLECGRTGTISHATAASSGFDPVTATITTASGSGYYPGTADTTVTLTADRTTGQLLGGSIVGTDRAAFRIDTLVTALDLQLTVPELERLDLAYAPPFSPVWARYWSLLQSYTDNCHRNNPDTGLCQISIWFSKCCLSYS